MANTPNSESTSNKTILGNGNPDGVSVGGATTDLVSLYGVTPIAQRSSASQAAVATTLATSTSPYGFGSTQANAIVTLLNEVRAALVAFGMIKGSA